MPACCVTIWKHTKLFSACCSATVCCVTYCTTVTYYEHSLTIWLSVTVFVAMIPLPTRNGLKTADSDYSPPALLKCRGRSTHSQSYATAAAEVHMPADRRGDKTMEVPTVRSNHVTTFHHRVQALACQAFITASSSTASGPVAQSLGYRWKSLNRSCALWISGPLPGSRNIVDTVESETVPCQKSTESKRVSSVLLRRLVQFIEDGISELENVHNM